MAWVSTENAVGSEPCRRTKKKNLTGIPWKTTAVCFADTKVLTGNKSKKLLMFEITPHSMTKSQPFKSILFYTKYTASKAGITINDRKQVSLF